MEMRVTVSVQGSSIVVHTDGRLSKTGVPELERVLRTTSGPVTLDLTNLLSADDVGIAALRTLSGQGVLLFGVSPYIALLLEPAPPVDLGSSPTDL